MAKTAKTTPGATKRNRGLNPRRGARQRARGESGRPTGPLASPAPELVDDLARLLVRGASPASALEWAQRRQGGGPAEAAASLAAARARIALAADFDAGEQLGQAILRLESLYEEASRAKDTRTALQAQRELNRLLGLTGEPEPEAAAEAVASDAEERLELIAAHLLPLGLTDESHPVEEHARIAADIIRRRGRPKK